MSEVRDSAIKLFGRTISLPLGREVNGSSASAPDGCSNHSLPSSSFSPCEEDRSAGEIEAEADENKELSSKELTSAKEDGTSASHQTAEGSKSPTTTTSSSIFENPKTPSTEGEMSLLTSSKNGEQSEARNSREKTPKKPDKILPCPRCNSMDTKFCYYNNYNVNQPRHFCKNCQRYWTAGGTMRNVPVGAGRRKNKNSSASRYRHIMVPEALQTAQAHAANGLHNAVLGNRAAVLTFGSDSPLCDSMASVLNLADKTQNGVLNGFHVPEQNVFVSCGDAHSIGASDTASTLSEKRDNVGSQESVDKSYQNFPPQMPCFPAGSPYPYPWNSTQWSSPMAPPPIFPPGYPVSFYPTPAYWGCAVPASWNIPCVSSQASVNNSASSSGPDSPSLGKHSRDGNILSPMNSQKEKPDKESTNSENGVLAPKTLRIDDPSEAAKSSIWSTLGIKNENSNSLNGGGLFKAFPSKGNDKSHVAEASPALHANPAALSRSLTFHERT